VTSVLSASEPVDTVIRNESLPDLPTDVIQIRFPVPPPAQVAAPVDSGPSEELSHPAV